MVFRVLVRYRDVYWMSPPRKPEENIPPSLIAKVKRAADAYHSSSASSPSEPLETYLAALESLMEYVSAGGRQKVVSVSAARARLCGSVKLAAKRRTGGRILQFVSPAGVTGSSAPFPAA